MKRIVVLDGHPDADRHRFVHALADSYADGAKGAGHKVRRIELARLDFPLLRSAAEWTDGALPRALKRAQDAIGWAEHIVILYPLWLGDMPALLKGFLEQIARPGFAIAPGKRPGGLLKGRTARLVVTMGMPAFFYRFYFGAHSVKSFERNILKFAGIRPVHHSLIGAIEGSIEARDKWLEEMARLGAAAE
jgi:putative NADPH-quinone reductase